jgi:hypothetical protein
MSIYSEQLAKLKKEIKDIESNRKKKRWKPNQKIMIDFINGVTEKAIFSVKGKVLVLETGHAGFGFKKIVLKHYNSNDLSALDIVNIAEVFERGITLNEEGVSDNDNTVYSHIKDSKKRLLVTGENLLGEIVVSYYRKT